MWVLGIKLIALGLLYPILLTSFINIFLFSH